MVSTSDGFRGEYFFLSNFYVSPVSIEFGQEEFVLATGEHVFQGMKVAAALSPAENVAALRRLEADVNPSKAKYWGRSIAIDLPRWQRMSEACMRRTLQLKFGQHPDLMERLVNTGDVELIEYNDWQDRLWGVDTATGEGENRLGKLLMSLREDIRTGKPGTFAAAGPVDF